MRPPREIPAAPPNRAQVRPAPPIATQPVPAPPEVRATGPAAATARRTTAAEKRNQTGRTCAAPAPETKSGEEERDAERHKHRAARVPGKRTQDRALAQPAEQRHDEPADDRREPEIGDVFQDGDPDVGPEHVQGAVREIRDAHQPEDEREARREQEQQAAEGEAVQRLNDPVLHKKRGRLSRPRDPPLLTTRDSSQAANRASTPDSSGTPPACRSRTGSRSGRCG